MPILLFLLGALLYCGAASLSYSESFKGSPGYYLAGAAVGVAANLVWFHLAAITKDKGEVLKMGLYWDSMLTLIYMLVPLILFSVKPTTNTLFGIVLITTGIILTKV